VGWIWVGLVFNNSGFLKKQKKKRQSDSTTSRKVRQHSLICITMLQFLLLVMIILIYYSFLKNYSFVFVEPPLIRPVRRAAIRPTFLPAGLSLATVVA